MTELRAPDSKKIDSFGNLVDGAPDGKYVCYVYNHMDVNSKCSGPLEFYQIELGVVDETPAVHAAFCKAHTEIGKTKHKKIYEALNG